MQEVKRYLKQIEYLKKSIESKREKIIELRAQAESITVILTPDVVQGGGMNNKSFADTVHKIIDLQGKISLDVYKQTKALEDITTRLDNMFRDYPELANILYLRYVNCLTWERVCVELDEGWTSIVSRKHPQALIVFKNYCKLV